MPAVANWSAPTQFDLTNPYNGLMSFNVQTGSGIYMLDQSVCDFQIAVRSTTDNVPQADGYILHDRFLTGTQMPLAIWLMEENDKPACGTLLQEMLDEVSGAFRSLLNAGDNEGRLAWEVDGGNDRMLDDVRLLVYPSYRMDTKGVVTVTIDSQYPYAQDLTQTRTPCSDGVPVTVTNTGTADYYPVFLVNMLNSVVSGSSCSSFLITNSTTGLQFGYDDTFPGAIAVAAGAYAEINTFGNTIYKNGNQTNLAAGVDQLYSDYFPLQVGPNVIEISGFDMDILWAPAWG